MSPLRTDWQVVQDWIGKMPPGALAELVGELTMPEADVAKILESWFVSAHFLRWTQDHPEWRPVLTVADWEALPDRGFGSPQEGTTDG